MAAIALQPPTMSLRELVRCTVRERMEDFMVAYRLPDEVVDEVANAVTNRIRDRVVFGGCHVLSPNEMPPEEDE